MPAAVAKTQLKTDEFLVDIPNLGNFKPQTNDIVPGYIKDFEEKSIILSRNTTF